ncbi:MULTISPECIES: Stk1 family PASTA domain-containing Ser/Thr kinase [Bacillaceae]|uniref:Stk1 family PASTA domain-containing Ser/Thr kinase n=1 Tax=Bacillaceae TaxID=186817 RepID=UPI001C56BA33|nr:Stk1 family PASTA domain-containing Ser/Thr kinase [Rossellomorea sp. YZS02]MBW3113919.1 Stk1 family PASTA domain-containing Ser/Thr kinase [Bacillus sp. MCCB 382]MDX8343050.1 Stk1 family PASTA domain-containing Ser/Thr kinase [Rossellomorea sp. YZS02]
MMEGKRISGRYRIIKLIGGGGMANVYLAHDVILDREVAIKMLRIDFANEEEFIKRFQREAQSATSLAHPNIVSIYDVGEEDDLYYIVMEYVHGMTLKQYIQQYSPVHVDKAIDIMKQLTLAMSHAHLNHIVHRDIKPHNILLDEDGNVKITDFGIAMALSATSITQTNSVLGSVHYLSPEQARGGMATKKSDIYSLGIVMFELLTGRLPFSGESAVSIALKHLQSETPSLKRWNPDIPQSVENIVLKATAKDPFRRYESLEEMDEDLTSALDPDRMDEPKFAVPLDDEATKAIPVITDQKAYSNLDDTIVHQTNTDIVQTKPTVPVKEDKKKAKKKDKGKKAKKDKRKRKWPIIIISLFFLLIVLGVAAFTLVPGLLGPKEIEVPDVAGKNTTEAVSMIVSEGFVVGETKEQSSDTVDEGKVIKTNPKAGRMANEGSEIDIYVSTGKEKVEVEDYVGKNFDEIASELEDKGFTIEKEEEFNDDEPSGTITDQDPSPGDEVVPEETTITFTVSKGSKPFDMENLEGYSKAELNQYADLKGLKIEQRPEEFSDTIEAGKVKSHDPSPGTPTFQGETVYVTMSKGPEPPKEEELPPKEVTLKIMVPYTKEDGTPQPVEIYIEDKDSTYEEPDQLDGITKDTEFTLSFQLEDGKDGKYKILRDGQEIDSGTAKYPKEE